MARWSCADSDTAQARESRQCPPRAACSSASSSRSLPQYISPPTKNVGAPNRPRWRALSVCSRRAFLLASESACATIAAAGSPSRPAHRHAAAGRRVLDAHHREIAVMAREIEPDLDRLGVVGMPCHVGRSGVRLFVDHQDPRLDALAQGCRGRDGLVEGGMRRETRDAVGARIVLLEDECFVRRQPGCEGPAMAR